MRTLTQKPKAAQKAVVSRAAEPGRTHTGAGHRVASVLQLQRTVGNRATRKLLSAAPVAGTPVVQRQPLAGGTWQPHLVKPIIKEKDTTPGQEIWKLVEKNDLKGTPSVVRTATIDKARHEWRITIKGEKEGSAAMPGPHGRTGEITTSKVGTTMVHTIEVKVNTILPSSAEEQALFPVGKKDVERVNFMAARTLYHEILHALISIDKTLPEGEKLSHATKTHEDLRTRAATDPAALAAKKEIQLTAARMASSAEATIGVVDLFDPSVTTPYPTHQEKMEDLLKAEGLDRIVSPEAVATVAQERSNDPLAHPSAQRQMFLRDSIDTLISEKHARSETGKAFKLPDYGSNKRTATEYGENIPKTIQSIARMRSRNPSLDLRSEAVWIKAERTLESQIEKFFNLLDQKPVEELMPAANRAPEALAPAEPATVEGLGPAKP